MFISRLWDGILFQRLIVRSDTDAICGLVQIYNYNPRGQNAYVAAIGFPEAQRTGLLVEGVIEALRHAFGALGLRKVYFETLDFNVPQFSGLARYCTEEARLHDHETHEGLAWDLIVLTLSQDVFENTVVPKFS